MKAVRKVYEQLKGPYPGESYLVLGELRAGLVAMLNVDQLTPGACTVRFSFVAASAMHECYRAVGEMAVSVSDAKRMLRFARRHFSTLGIEEETMH